MCKPSNQDRRGARLAAWAVVLATGLGACALPVAVNPHRLDAATSAALAQRWGAPTAKFALEGGGERWEYATGPQGRQTVMVDLDGAGRVVAAEQVLTEANFERIRVGDSVAAVRRALGRPSETGSAGLRGGELWTWIYPTVTCTTFQIVVERDRVAETGYGLDPRCRHRF